MFYSKIYDHSLFLASDDEIYRKHSNAFAVKIRSGRDRIFAVKESVTPISRAQAASILKMDMKYL